MISFFQVVCDRASKSEFSVKVSGNNQGLSDPLPLWMACSSPSKNPRKVSKLSAVIGPLGV